MKILIIGAGVIGSFYAAKLKQSGNEVTILARGKRFQEIKQHGLTVRNAFSGERFTVKLPVIEKLDSPNYDLVVIHVRANQLDVIVQELFVFTELKTILFMLNFPGGFEKIAQKLGKERVIIGFPGAGGMIDEAGTVIATVSPGFVQPTTFGELDGQISSRLINIAKAYHVAGFPTALSTNMDAWLKTHVTWTLPLECMLYHYSYNCKKIAQDKKAVSLVVDGIKEGIAVLKKLKISLNPWLINFIFNQAPKNIPVFIVNWWFNSKNVEVFTTWHTKNAPDEALFLAQEFKKLILLSELKTPSLNLLYSYIPEA